MTTEQALLLETIRTPAGVASHAFTDWLLENFPSSGDQLSITVTSRGTLRATLVIDRREDFDAHGSGWFWLRTTLLWGRKYKDGRRVERVFSLADPECTPALMAGIRAAVRRS